MTVAEVVLGAVSRLDDPAAHHLRESFADRHVPLSASLAQGLAALLRSPRPLADPVWGRAFLRMAEALGVSGSMASQQLLKIGIERFPLIVAEPVLRAAAARAGAMPLTAAAGAIPDDTGFATAEAALEQFVMWALFSTDEMGAAFWVQAGLDYTANAQRLARQRSRAQAAGLPEEIDAALAAMIFLHPPEFTEVHNFEKQRRKARQLSDRRRSGIRPKEGGVTGILQSRNFDDLPDALMSELILPKALLANKLLQEGLLTRHRPPRRDPRRDLLALTMSHATASDGMGCVVKAAWADAAMRLRLALAQMGLVNSDLVWSGPGTIGLVDAHPDQRGALKLPPLRLSGRARADMLLRSGLLPGHAVWPRPEAAPERGTETQACLRGGLSALAARHKTGVKQVAQTYGHRFLLLAQPWTKRQLPDWPELRARHSDGLHSDLGACFQAALIWQPDAKGGMPELIGYADGREPVNFALDEADAADPLAAFLGSLVLWMMDVTLEALDVAQT